MAQPFFSVGGVVVGGVAGVVFAPSPFPAGAPRSDFGTLGVAFFSGSQPTAKTPTQTVRTNASVLCTVSNSLVDWKGNGPNL